MTEEGYISVSTGTFQVYVNLSSPEIIYRYRQDRPGLPFFVVTLTRLVFFDDEAGGIYTGETPVASVVLTNYKWNVGNVEVLGPRVSFDLAAQVPIPASGGYVSADVTVTCIVTNGTSPYPGTSQFLQGGASELKLDLTINTG